MEKLRDRMLVDLQLSGAKRSTQRTYLREAENLAKYFHKPPEQLGENELKAYLLHLMNERHLSEGTFRFYVAALKFLYRTTLKREWPVEKIRYPQVKRKLPVVLDLSDVQSLFSVTKNLKHIDKIKERGGIKKLQTSRCLRARSMTLIMGVYGISEVLVNIEDMSGRDIYDTN